MTESAGRARLIADLEIVLGAAKEHANNDQHWRGVHGPAYFEANLKRDENRRILWQAIEHVRAAADALAGQEEAPTQGVSVFCAHCEIAIGECPECGKTEWRFAKAAEDSPEPPRETIREKIEAFQKSAKRLEALSKARDPREEPR
jgi:hypothetical protein